MAVDSAILVSLLHLVLAALALALAARWLAIRSERPVAGACWLLAGVGGAAAVAFALPPQASWALATPLREGGSEVAALTLMARPVTAGPSWHALTDLFASEPLPLRALVHANLALAAAGLGVVGSLASQLFERGWVPVVAVAAVALTPTFAAGAVAELPGPLLTLYFAAGLVAYATLRAGPGALLRWTAALTIALAAGLAAATRIELAIVAVPAASAGVGYASLGRSRTEAIAARVDGRLRSGARWLGERVPWSLAGLISVVLVTRVLGPDGPHVRAAYRALNPLDPTVLTYPAVLLEVMSVGAVALFLLGWAHALRRWLRYALLPLTLPCLFKAYYASCHDGTAVFEMFRYQTLLVGPTAFLALLGWRPLAAWAASRAVDVRWLGALACVALLAFWPGLVGVTAGRSLALRDVGDDVTEGGWLATNFQREVRALAEARRRYPDCALIVPIARREPSERRTARFSPGGFVVLRGASLERYDPPTLEALRAAHPSTMAGCALYHRGLDCHITSYEGCEEDVHTMTALAEREFLSDPYGEPEEYGPYEGRIRLRLHRLGEAP